MPGELFLAASSAGLTVDADIYREGGFLSTVRLTAVAGGGGTTNYRGNMPTGAAYPRGKYTVTYRVGGNSELQGPDIVWWTGTAELDLALLQAQLLEIRGTGFFAETDSLEALSNAISQIPTSGGTSSGSFLTSDRSTLARIEAFAKFAEAGARGDFLVDRALNRGTLLNADGTTAAIFQLRNIDGQPSIEQAVQRVRIQ